MDSNSTPTFDPPPADALAITQERLALALDAAGGIGTWDWDVHADLVYSDARFAQLFSVDPQRAATGASLAEFTSAIHPDDLPHVARAIEQTVANGGEYTTEYRIVQPNAPVRWVLSRGRCSQDKSGPSPRFSGVVFDITERKQVEEKLSQKARLAALGADVATALADKTALDEALQRCAEAIVVHLDAAFARIWTLNVADNALELHASAGLYTHLDGPHARVPVGSYKIGLIAEERQPHLTNDVMHDPRLSDPDWARQQGMVSFAGYPLIVEGRLGGVLALFSRHQLGDDTMQALESVSTSVAIGIQRKRTELALQQSEFRYRFLAESMPQMVWTATPDGALDYVSSQAASYFGVPVIELLGAGWLAGVYPDDRDKATALWLASVKTGKPYEAEFRLRRGHDGSWRWFLARAHSMCDLGKVVSWVGTCTDIHEQKMGQDALAKANRELEEFAYVSSHDLQEPLRMVNIYTQLLLRQIDSQAPIVAQYAEFIHRGVHRMDELLRDLLTFSRSIHSEKEALGTADLSLALKEALAVLDSRIKETGAIIKAAPLPNTAGETSQLTHVFQNLLSNALKYRKGSIEIEVGAERNGNNTWVISIHDNGIGFDQKYAEQIFGLFKRLHKDEYPGTGLGLAICQRIVERYGGRMWAVGDPGKGATFYFSLPSSRTE